MILSRPDINRHLGYDDLRVERESNGQLTVEPSSMDLHLGDVRLIPWKGKETGPVVVDDPQTYPKHTEDETWTIPPKGFMLAHTDEEIDLPDSQVGFVHGRSSVGRLGLFIHNAGLIDAGFNGNITLDLFNAAGYPIELKPDMRIAQMTIHEHQTPPELGYGEKNGNKYQNQMGPTPSRLYEDFN